MTKPLFINEKGLKFNLTYASPRPNICIVTMGVIGQDLQSDQIFVAPPKGGSIYAFDLSSPRTRRMQANGVPTLYEPATGTVEDVVKKHWEPLLKELEETGQL